MPAPAVSNPPFHFDSWNRNQGMCRAQGLSLAAHSLVAVILLIPLVHPILGPSLEHREARVSSTVFFPPYRHALPAGKKPAHGGGSGGNEDLTPATKGKLAPFSWLQITPPAMPHTPDTKLAAVGTLLGPPEIRLPEERLRNYGLPDASAVTDSPDQATTLALVTAVAVVWASRGMEGVPGAERTGVSAAKESLAGGQEAPACRSASIARTLRFRTKRGSPRHRAS